jgi:FAD/FMN-containing dehydrogenase
VHLVTSGKTHSEIFKKVLPQPHQCALTRNPRQLFPAQIEIVIIHLSGKAQTMQQQPPGIDGTKTLSKDILGSFTSMLSGTAIVPGSEHYESARLVWNGMIDKRPAIIARCVSASDVVCAVKFAAENGLQVAVRGGGHNISGNSVCDGGIVIDLSTMKGIRVDAARKEVYAQAGLTWGEFDKETQAHGLATPGGLISTTGIAGLTLGGGFGWLSRKYGLACDNVLSVDIVTADGRFLTASPNEHQDLFWGIRGGGGNFGIVTSFRFTLHPVSMVFGSFVFHPFEDVEQTLRFYREFSRNSPDELGSFAALLTAPPAPFLPTAAHGQKLTLIASCYCGPINEGERVVQPVRTLGHPVADLSFPQPYVAIQSAHDPTAPPGMRNYWKSEFVTELSDDLIRILAHSLDSVPSPLNAIHIYHMQGAISRLKDEATAYSHRDGRFLILIIAMWTDSSEDERQIRWAREVWERIRAFSLGGGYVNFLGDEGEERVKTSYGEATYARLMALKKTYDPSNFFRMNQNIPAGR